MEKFTYDKFEIDFASLPVASQRAMIQRGINHFLGNEQASKVSAHFADVADVTAEQKAAYKAECQEKAMQALLAGTVGAVVRAPKGDTVEGITRELARTEVADVLKQHGLSFPSGKDKDGNVKVVTFPDGTRLTGAELIERRIAKHGDRLRKEAEAELKARERKAAKEAGDLGAALL